MSHNRVITFVGLAVIALALFFSACADEQQIRDEARFARETLTPVVEDLERQQQALAETIADPETPPEQVAAAQEGLELVEDQLGLSSDALQAAIEIEADPAQGIVGQTMQLVMPFLPEPYRLPVVLGSGILASLIRQWQLRKAGRDIARGVQVAAEADADLKKRLQASGALISMHQGATARRIVDEAQGKKPARPL